jgi:hypothetical protein
VDDYQSKKQPPTKNDKIARVIVFVLVGLAALFSFLAWKH